MLNDIQTTIENKKKYKYNFDLGFKFLNSLIYLNLIVKGIFSINSTILKRHEAVYCNLLHRNIVFSQINEIAVPLFTLAKDCSIKIACSKLILVLTEYVFPKKIKYVKKHKYNTDIYLGFKNIQPFALKNRVSLVYSKKPFKIFQNFMIGCSCLTLSFLTKKSVHQHEINEINSNALLISSTTPINICLKN